MNIFVVVLTIICWLAMLFTVVMLIKNNVTYRNYTIIIDAIFDYRMDVITKSEKNGTIVDGVKCEVEYDDMREYNNACMRIFDWGYKNILPNDKFEIIKPYIHK